MAFVYFQTFGCQMNIADSDELRRKLIGRGFVDTESIDDADLIVVNTCSVREHAEQRAKARITEFAKIKKKHAKLWVIGCMAQRLGDTLKKEIPLVDLVVGAKQIDLIEQNFDKYLPFISADSQNILFGKTAVSDFVSVMRGCNNYCSYCIVPYVRGDEVSIPVETIEGLIRQRVSEGIKEITLLGQNVNSYNNGGLDFPDLLKRIAVIDGLERIRFTTSHPKDCSDKLIYTMAGTPKICHHIHLPVQAGADTVLQKMNRKYTAEQYLRKIDTFKKVIPHIDITTDILVGFPGETEEEFGQTLDLVKDVRFTTAFMFAYSMREGTAAANLKEEISRDEKLARLNRLIALQTTITKEIFNEMVGNDIEVLLSGQQEKRDQLWMGQDFGSKRILLSGMNMQTGMIVRAKVIRSSGMTLIAEQI
jgi:tRNA-2-methylthio-N6-dimethylallyladenosine synthase